MWWTLGHTRSMNGQTVHMHVNQSDGRTKRLVEISGLEFGQRRQCNYNLAHEISLLVPIPHNQSHGRGEAGKPAPRPMCWVVPALSTILLIMR